MPPQNVSQKLAVGKEILVHISVLRNDASGEIWLERFPQRRGETAIYFTLDENADRRSATKPRQVIWEVDGLKSGERLDIEAKPGSRLQDFNPGDALLPQDVYSIVYGDNVVRSGEVKRRTSPGRELAWSYSITLRDAKNSVLAFIDPDVTIIEDP